MIRYREICESEIDRELFSGFIRHQMVVKCLRRENREWVIRDDPFVDDWSEEDYTELIKCLKNTVRMGGLVYGAFLDDVLKGFASVEPVPFGTGEVYLDLSSLHVSEDIRRQGIGRDLFLRAKQWAKANGAKKLYISSHSAIESQSFYKSMGCVEAVEYNKMHTEAEPFDCQLECCL